MLKMTVRPSSRASRMVSFSTSWFTGSRPEKGSSRITNCGSCAIDASTCTFWPMPFESASVFLSAILRACFERGIQLRGFHQTEVTLHDVFVRLVGPEAREASFR